MKEGSPSASSTNADFLLGGGEMGAGIRAHDWAKTPLGALETWPQCLRTVVRLLLDSGFPMLIAWGREFTPLYNDAWRSLLGSTRQPTALGQSAAESFAAIWDGLGPAFERVLEVGEAATLTDQRLELNRHGTIEAGYFTFSCSALRDETGKPGGVFVTLIETTARVQSEQQIPAPHGLAAPANQPHSAVAISAADFAQRKQAQEADAYLAAVVRSSSEAVVGLSLDGLIKSWNPAAEQLFGYSADEALGQSISLIALPEYHAEQSEFISRAHAGDRVDTEVVRRTRSGQPVHVILKAAPVIDKANRMIGISATLTDITERKRAEEKLRESEDRFAKAFNASPLAMTISSLKTGKLIEVNDTFSTMSGYTREEAIGQSTVDLGLWIEPEERESGLETIKQMGRMHNVEHRFRLRNGEEAAGLLSAELIEISGEPCVLTVLLDITERKRDEKALREHEEQFRLLFENSADAILITDDDGHYLGANRAACEMLGYTHEQLLKMKVADLAVTNSVDAGERFRTYSQRGHETDDFYFARPDGEHRIAQYTASRFAPGRHLSILRDITERKQAEESARKQSERLRLLWEAAAVLLTTDEPDAMLQGLFSKIAAHFRLDSYFNFMVNDAGDGLRLESCKGITEETARSISRLEYGQAICGTVAVQREPITATFIQQSDDPKVQLVKSFGIRVYACNPLLADDRLLGTLSFASRQRDQFDADELEFLRTISRYVTVAYERLRLVNELRETDRRKDEFLATLAHELRNPLAPIRNALHVMHLAKDEAETVERARTLMERQLQQMVRLIDDLLDVSRISRGKIELRKERSDLATVVQNAIETSQPLIDQYGHTLTVNIPAEPIAVEADVTRLAQVFANLLNNAAKYTEQGGTIHLTVNVHEREVAVCVQDNGIGISKQMLPRVFEMFAQVDRSLEKSKGGLGIGLNITRRLVEMHGGTIEAHSAGHGQGSEFVVCLPVLAPVVEPSKTLSADQPADATPRRRILVADDNEDSAVSLAIMLRFMGNEVRTAHDGIEAVAVADEFHPDVILLDIGMPGLNGYDACRRIREKPWASGTVIMALTGWGQDEDKRRSRDAGFNHHLVKPVEPDTLEKLLAPL